MLGIGANKQRLPRPGEAPAGRSQPEQIVDRHFVHGRPLRAQPDGMRCVLFGMGCFWGAERKFWSLPGVHTTAVGYAGGETANPTYREVCSGMTGHSEVVRVVFDPRQSSLQQLLEVFWESHDPTQGMRQGNDVGSQYRSAVYAQDEGDAEIARNSAQAYAERLKAAGFDAITTEIRHDVPFYFADDAHQQYLAKNPGGYCGIGGTGVSCAG